MREMYRIASAIALGMLVVAIAAGTSALAARPGAEKIIPNSAADTCTGGAITIPDSGNGIPYPSTCVVSGSSGTITDLNMTVTGASHTWPDDIDMLLVGPGGQNAKVWSDAGGSLDIAAVNVDARRRGGRASCPTRRRSRPAPGGLPTTSRRPTSSRRRRLRLRGTSTCRSSTGCRRTAPGTCTWSTTQRPTRAPSKAGR